MLMLMAIDVVVMVADVIQVVLDGGPDGIRGGMGEVVNLMSACGCVCCLFGSVCLQELLHVVSMEMW